MKKLSFLTILLTLLIAAVCFGQGSVAGTVEVNLSTGADSMKARFYGPYSIKDCWIPPAGVAAAGIGQADSSAIVLNFTFCGHVTTASKWRVVAYLLPKAVSPPSGVTLNPDTLHDGNGIPIIQMRSSGTDSVGVNMTESAADTCGSYRIRSLETSAVPRMVATHVLFKVVKTANFGAGDVNGFLTWGCTKR